MMMTSATDGTDVLLLWGAYWCICTRGASQTLPELSSESFSRMCVMSFSDVIPSRDRSSESGAMCFLSQTIGPKEEKKEAGLKPKKRPNGVLAFHFWQNVCGFNKRHSCRCLSVSRREENARCQFSQASRSFTRWNPVDPQAKNMQQPNRHTRPDLCTYNTYV